MDKPKILFIGDYCRTDYLRMLDKAKDACDFWFLYFTSPDEEQSKSYLEYGQAIYWSDYKSAQALLKALAPHKVLFLHIDIYHAVVLNLACKTAGIPTYHLEHGMRADYDIAFDATISPQLYRKPIGKFTGLRNTLYSLGDRIKARFFLKNSIRQLSEADAAFAKEYIQIRGKHNYLETFKKLPSNKRTADCYISFSPKVYKVHQQHDHLPASQKVHFVGIPYFDKLATIEPTIPERSILFIDQPLAEQGLLQWNMKYKESFTTDLAFVCQANGYRLLVKPHPKQDLQLWERLEQQKLCTLLNDDQLTQQAPGIPVVLGFYSTYLMPFAAYSHTTVITFEKHPAGAYVVSEPLVKAGVAKPIYNLKELNQILPNLAQLHQQQLPNKAKFTEEWMYKFDGKSGERLKRLLLTETALEK